VLLRERIGTRLIVAIALSFAGLVILTGATPAALMQNHARVSVVGDALIVLGMLFGAVTVVLSKDLLATYRPVVVVAGSFVVGGLALVPLSVYELSTGATGVLTVGSVSILAYLALVVGLLSYLLWMWILQWTQASTVGVFHYVSPLAGALIGALLLGETLGLSAIVGGAAILAGLGVTVGARPAPG
jgi:drug/metabolite transporter (DMT)-like permease